MTFLWLAQGMVDAFAKHAGNSSNMPKLFSSETCFNELIGHFIIQLIKSKRLHARRTPVYKSWSGLKSLLNLNPLKNVLF